MVLCFVLTLNQCLLFLALQSWDCTARRDMIYMNWNILFMTSNQEGLQWTFVGCQHTTVDYIGTKCDRLSKQGAMKTENAVHNVNLKLLSLDLISLLETCSLYIKGLV